MTSDILAQFATGGATRPDSFSGMNSQFSTALGQLMQAAPPEIRKQLQVSSGYRSVERQAQLWADALKKYGSPTLARKWVAPPGRSNHNHGTAADLKYLSPAAQQWAHANAGNYGLAFPLKNENWHIELAGARGGQPHHQHAHEGAQAPSVPAPPMQQAAPVAAAPVVSPNVSAPPKPLGLGGTIAGMFANVAQPQADVAEELEARRQAERARREALLGSAFV